MRLASSFLLSLVLGLFLLLQVAEVAVADVIARCLNPGEVCREMYKNGHSYPTSALGCCRGTKCTSAWICQ